MSAVPESQAKLLEARKKLNEGKAAAENGKSSLEGLGQSFEGIENARSSALRHARLIGTKLIEVQTHVVELDRQLNRGGNASLKISNAAQDASQHFKNADDNARSADALAGDVLGLGHTPFLSTQASSEVRIKAQDLSERSQGLGKDFLRSANAIKEHDLYAQLDTAKTILNNVLGIIQAMDRNKEVQDGATSAEVGSFYAGETVVAFKADIEQMNQYMEII